MHMLNEKDSMWVDLRHRHFADACNDISSQMDQFRTKNAAARHRSNGGGSLDVGDMRKLVQALPQFRCIPRPVHPIPSVSASSHSSQRLTARFTTPARKGSQPFTPGT